MQSSFYLEREKKIPIVKEYDVIIIGGSQSGVAAAVCAARQGVKVLLVEKNSFLGGQSITSLVLQYEKSAFMSSKGYLVTKGIAREILDKVVQKGTSDRIWEDPLLYRHRDGDAWLDPEAIKQTLLEMCLEAGVDLLFDSLCIDVMMTTGNTPRVEGIIVQNRSGRQALKARIVVDASAFLEVVWYAMEDEGILVEKVEDRMTPGWFTEFRGIDSREFIDYIINNNVCSGYPSLKEPETVWRHYETGRFMIYHGFANALDKADDEGILDDWPEEMNLPFRLTVKSWNIPPIINDRWCMVMDQRSKDALDAWEMSQADVDRQVIDWKLLKIFRFLPGWENAYISRTSIHLGLRDTRRLKAVTMLSRKDVFEPDHDRQDAIGFSDGHDAGRNRLQRPYPIPFGILVPEKLDGVICCSRALGVSDRTALDAHRGLTPTMVVGQAAGTAAALAALDRVEVRNVDVQKLRAILKENGVILEPRKVED
ncbi:MAG: FAD-dependent oxidoreductase [Candidatus Hodarchaeota archaeon]